MRRLSTAFRFAPQIIGSAIVLLSVTLLAQPRDAPRAIAAPLGESVCGSLQNHFGPFDYRTVKRSDREIVERFHFGPQVESLTKGISSYIGDDIDYTLRAMPNHHRALSAMDRLAQKERTDRPQGAKLSVECYFDRAIRMAPDDGRTFLAYGIFLHERKRTKEAQAALEHAVTLGPNDATIAYNYALILLDLKNFEKARNLARQAYAGGVNLPGLANRLKAAGYPIE